MHRSWLLRLMNFDSCIHLYNHHPKQDMEHFIHPRKFLYASFLSIPSPTPREHILISISLVWSACSKFHVNGVCVLLCLVSFTQHLWGIHPCYCAYQ